VCSFFRQVLRTNRAPDFFSHRTAAVEMLLVRSNAPTVHVLIDIAMGLILTIVPISFLLLMDVLQRQPCARWTGPAQG
jgi:hypothetical protein